MESGVSARCAVSPARAVRPDSNDCISRSARGMGKKPLEVGLVGDSKVALSPNGCGMRPGNALFSNTELENGEGGTEPFGHCMTSAKMSAVGCFGGSEKSAAGCGRGISAPVTLCE